METTLDRIEEGKRVTVTSVNLPIDVRHRLMVMGIRRGARVTVENSAPLRDPLKVRVKGHAFSIRKGEASRIGVRD